MLCCDLLLDIDIIELDIWAACWWHVCCHAEALVDNMVGMTFEKS